MAHDMMMKGFVATFLASPLGQEMIHRYLSSAEGQVSIREYLTIPERKQTAKAILPLLLVGIDLKDNVRILLRDAVGRKP